MANQLQEQILKAIDILVNNRIDNMQTDKTVVATIVTCTNALTGEYKVSYNGGFMTAYAQENVTYTDNSSVYVLIPQNDFTQKKMIISKSQALENDKNISFVSSALSDYNLIGKNPITDKNKVLPIGLYSYLKNNYSLIYQYGEESTTTHPFVQIDVDELTNNLKEAEALMIEASFYTRLPKLHRLSDSGLYGIQFVLAFKDADNVDDDGNAAIKYLSYTLDNNNMTGNPYLYTTWSDQYAIYPIDIENFLYIDSILFFAQDFVEKDDTINQELWGADIFVKDLEIYGLKKITAVNGEYKLSLSTPQGSTFKSIQSTDSLQVIGKITQKNTTNLSDATMFYWFAEDGRVTSSSEDYQMYGGAGWRRLKDKGSNYTLTLYGSENRAYENKYLCVAVYKETVILKEYFTIYNEAAKRDISITSTLGVKFSFDRGKPTLICLIDGKEKDFEAGKANPHKDEWFRFVWSKVDEYGQTTIFNQTLEQLQEAYDQGVKDGIGYSALSALKNQMLAMEDVEFELGKNKLTYPVKQIDASATFKCSVYLKDNAAANEYYIGTAEIVLQNENAASPTDYYILIENGDQVFQYSESGVAPDNDRYTDPLEIKPLTCHFYDPAGLEVNKNTYEIKWLVPLSDSLIVVPKEGMTINYATEKVEYCTSEIYPMAIKQSYDYQALNNQIKAIVTYQGQEYTQETTFLFTKVGENGTNGTDVVAKIMPISTSSILQNELLTLELVDNVAQQWNTKQTPGDKVLTFDLYQRNERLSISSDKITWSIAGGNSSNKSKYMSVSDGRITWSATDAAKRIFRNQIVRGMTSLEGQSYYAFYPIPVVNYKSSIYGDGKKYHIAIDSKKTLKSITYNSDGRNPLYNKNQGIFINIQDLVTNSLSDKYIVWSAEGGLVTVAGTNYEDNPDNAAIQLTYEKDSKDGKKELRPRDNEDGTYELLNEIYILPSDIYDGAYCNNLVHGKVYNNKQAWNNGLGNPEAEIYIPIYMSLNTFGLASLNAWDGNHVEINEDENYILAPQIGAGQKDNENKFTGVVMGTAQTYDQKDPSIGLLGYSHGKQSILLDAETGNAIFGLPEEQASANNQYTEGRIKLVPGGTSEIGSWKIGSRSLYNVVDGQIDNKYSDLGSEYKSSIPHNKSGILFSADPAYTSIKGRLLGDGDADYSAANTVIQKGDTFELQLDPNDVSIFTVFRHTNAPSENLDTIIASDNKMYITDLATKTARYSVAEYTNGKIVGWTTKTQTKDRAYVVADQYTDGTWVFHSVSTSGTYLFTQTDKLQQAYKWRREAKVGINNQGRFYTNALKDSTTSLNIGPIGAFGLRATTNEYVGATFEVGTGNTSNTLFKMFTDMSDVNSKTGALYLSGATDVSSEYQRPISIHAKEIALYSSLNSNQKTTNDRLILNTSSAIFGHEKSYLSIPTNDTAKLELNNNLSISTASNRDTTISTRNFTSTLSGNFTSTIAGNVSNIISGSDTNKISGEYQLNSKTFKLQMLTSQMTLGENNNKVYLQFNPSAISLINADAGWNIKSKTGGITINTTNSANGIVLQASPPNGNSSEGVRLTMLPQDGGGSDFLLSSPHGSIQSKSNLGNNRNGIQLAPGISTSWGVISGALPSTTTSLQVSNDIVCNREIIAYDDFKVYGADHWYCLYNGLGLWWSDGYSWNESDFKNAWNRSLDWANTKGSFDSRIYNAQNRADSAYNYAGEAYSRANSAYNLAENKAGNDVWDHVHKANNCLSAVKNVCYAAQDNITAKQLANSIAAAIANHGN